MYSALPYGNQSLLATFQVASAPLLTYIFAFLSASQIKMLGQALGLLVPVSYIHYCITSAVISVVLLIVGILFFNKKQDEFILYV